MRIESLQLSQFKNYAQLDLSFPESPLVIFVGDNGHGKTNILESIVILALSKSFQTMALRHLVNWEFSEASTGLPEVFRIAGQVKSQLGLHELEVMCGTSSKYPKTLKVDGISVKPADYVGHLRVVLFTPQDINMILLAPQLRRRYMDIFISQTDSVYLHHLSQFQTVLKQRNSLLSAIQENRSRWEELAFWDEQMGNHGGYVLWKRRQVVEYMNHKLSSHYESIGREAVHFQLLWKSSWNVEATPEATQQHFFDYLQNKRQRDIAAETTCGGPHRDDFSFQMNGRDLAEFGSRGECRTAVLALKLTEMEYIKEHTGDPPVLLFDDVFSELDINRQQQFLEQCDAEQVIISTTHVEYPLPDATIWKVQNGTITS